MSQPNSPADRPAAHAYLGGSVLAELMAAMAVRDAQLRARLKGSGHAVPDTDATHEVMDQKELADTQASQRVDDAEAELMRQELARLARAQTRAREHRYGLCLACGEPVSLQRLRAMPEAELCLPCQSAQEAAPSRAGR